MNAEPKADAHQRATASDAGLTKFDADTLKGIGSTALVTSNGGAFLPATMAEAMELGKLMCMSNFVPQHLRQKPGDCLAVVMQATRWGMDPFAVANKTYFVNDRMAYEAQLVSAVLNARAPLDGRLQVSWDGDGPTLTCKVVGRIKGDPEPHTVWQEINTITTRNSPLWKTSPRQQLAYYTTRMWARLFCPEVLLGVYTEDEARDMGPMVAQEDGSQVIPPRPTRVTTRDASEQARKGAAGMDAQFRQTMAEEDPEPEHDQETGEVTAQDSAAKPPPTPAGASVRDEIIRKVADVRGATMLDAIFKDYEQDIDLLRTDAPDDYQAVMRVINEKRGTFPKKR